MLWPSLESFYTLHFTFLPPNAWSCFSSSVPLISVFVLSLKSLFWNILTLFHSLIFISINYSTSSWPASLIPFISVITVTYYLLRGRDLLPSFLHSCSSFLTFLHSSSFFIPTNQCTISSSHVCMCVWCCRLITLHILLSEPVLF